MKKVVGAIVLVIVAVTLLLAQTATKYTGAQHAVSIAFPALSATGSTQWVWIGDTGVSKHAVQLICTGTPTTIAGNLEGSIESTPANATTVVAASATCGATAWEATGAKPILWVRFTLGTLTGGTSPTVTALYMGAR